MEWIQVFTIIISLAGFMYWIRSDLKEDINRVDQDCRAANQRIDQLYQIIVDMLKTAK
jgi:hypothetical protein